MTNAESQAAQRKRNEENGKCLRHSTRDPAPNSKLCAECLKDQAERTARQKQRNEENGKCRDHAKRDPAPGSKYCPDCLAAGANRRDRSRKGAKAPSVAVGAVAP